MRTYLQHQCTPVELTQLHGHFLDAYTMKRWADLPKNEPYLWDYLAIHLIAASRTPALITTVMDGAYLVSKAHYRTLSLLEQDLTLAIKHDPDNLVLHSLQHSITNMAHLLHTCQTWQESANVIHSRLVHFPEFQSLCQSLEHRLTRPYLTAWHALPDLPMNALRRTLTGHTNGVIACAISPDGSWLLSASRDGTLRIWDVTSGQCRHSSKKSSVLLHTRNLLVSAENDNPHWMDYQRCLHLLTILYLLCLRIGGYVSTIGSTYLTYGSAFTRETDLSRNP